MKITLPEQPPKIKEEDKNRAVFVIEGLYPGYGVTVGNAMRRALYSSIPGASITKVKIKGAPHEFSTLPGVLEDILEITLNIKQISLRLYGDEPQIVSVKAKGARSVTANDITGPSQVEIISKDVHIATLTSKDAVFEAEFTVEAGLGYIPVEQRQNVGAEIGSIPLDAIFTPIRKVNFEIENMRVGDRTDYNRLSLEIVTNGAISPREALVYAGKLLASHFELASNIELPKAADSKKHSRLQSKKMAAKKNSGEKEKPKRKK